LWIIDLILIVALFASIVKFAIVAVILFVAAALKELTK